MRVVKFLNVILKRIVRISNNILSIAINEELGEVFVATDRGLVSFIDIAQSPKAEMGSLKVYPNPFYMINMSES